MCTVSWLHTEGGYHLLCNRDELSTRKPALAPRLQKLKGTRVIAPEDGDHGGSWIAVNEFGLALCLLNRYDDSPDKPTISYTSRGLLLTELIDSPSIAIARDRIRQTDLSGFRPFTILVLEPGSPALIAHWTGQERSIIENGESEMPLISSSFDTRGVTAFRKELFKRLSSRARTSPLARSGCADEDLLRAFHKSHAPVPSAYSPCMHRTDARTVSLSWIKVAHRKIEFLYCPDAPCSGVMMEPVEFERAQRLS